MKRSLIACCFPLLLSGCAYYGHLPMYSDYQRIRVGRPPPADIQKDTNWGARTRITWPHDSGVTEEARYLVGSDGKVTAKWYQGGGGKVSLLFMWYQWRARTQGCVLIPADKAGSDRDVVDFLKAAYKELWSTPPDKQVTEALRVAEHKGGLSRPGFATCRLKTNSDAVSLMFDRTEWKILRCDCGGVEVTVDHREDISLLVWTIIGNIGFLTGNPP